VSENSESDSSGNSALGDKEIARLQASPQVVNALLASPKLASPTIATPKLRLSCHPRTDGTLTEIPVDIGRSVRGNERAEMFTRVRRQRSPRAHTCSLHTKSKRVINGLPDSQSVPRVCARLPQVLLQINTLTSSQATAHKVHGLWCVF
jgi:hypothetical protein